MSFKIVIDVDSVCSKIVKYFVTDFESSEISSHKEEIDSSMVSFHIVSSPLFNLFIFFCFQDVNNTSIPQNQILLYGPIVNVQGWLKTEINASTSFQLIQVKGNQNDTIPLESSRIQMHWNHEVHKHRLFINTLLKNEAATFQLRVQANNPSSSVERVDSTIETCLTTEHIAEDYHDTSVTNVLLIGRSRVGKSTLIESLNDCTDTWTDLLPTQNDGWWWQTIYNQHHQHTRSS